MSGGRDRSTLPAVLPRTLHSAGWLGQCGMMIVQWSLLYLVRDVLTYTCFRCSKSKLKERSRVRFSSIVERMSGPRDEDGEDSDH